MATSANPAIFLECEANLAKLAEYYATHSGDRNEATTRFHLINALLTECLAWDSHGIILEEHQREERDEYTDFTFYAPRRVMILEAKREQEYFEVPTGFTGLKYPLRTLLRKNTNLKKAIQQVSRYCQNRGVPLAAISNGHQLIAFVANRVDGESPMNGDAVVFVSLSQMLTHFDDLWKWMSRFGIEDKNLQTTLLGSRQPELPPKLASRLGHDYPGTKGRNEFQADLKIITEIVLEDIVGSSDVESEFLKHCYCQSDLRHFIGRRKQGH